jgi:hypothetical protein
LRGAINAKRLGLNNAAAVDAAARDVSNAAIAPAVGPVVRTLLSTQNAPSGFQVPKPNPVAVPGESQFAGNLANTAYNVNSLIGAARDSGALGKLMPWLPYVNQEPPKPTSEVVSKQLPRMIPQPGKPPGMVRNYPEIVEKAQSKDFLDDVIHRARQMEMGQRTKYVTDQINLMPPAERMHAWTEVQRRRVFTQ